MAVEEKQNLIQNLLEGLDELNPDYIFPMDKILFEDIKERLEKKSEEEKEKLSKFFYFPLEEKKVLEEFAESIESPVEEKEEISEVKPEIEEIPSELKEDQIEGLPETTSDYDTELALDLQKVEPSEIEMPEISDVGKEIEVPQIDITEQDKEGERKEFGETQIPDLGDIGKDLEIDTGISAPEDKEVSFEMPNIELSEDNISMEDTSSVPTLEEPTFDDNLGLDLPSEKSDQEYDIQNVELGSPISQEEEHIGDTDLLSKTDSTDFLSQSEDFSFSPTEEKQEISDLGSVDVGIDVQDLKEMEKKTLLEEGIGADYTEEELAKLRESLLSYSEPIKKVIIDAIVNEKLPRTDQKLLMNMIIEGIEEKAIADFIEEKLGFRPKISVDKTKEGIPIIYVDEVSPEALQRRKKRAKLFLILFSSVAIGIVLFLSGLRIYNYYRTTNLYELGLEELKKAENVNFQEKEKLIENAEKYFYQALKNEEDYNIKFLHRYATSYIRLGKYEKAFEKLFGKISPEYAWNSPMLRVPLIQKSTSWKNISEIENGYYTEFFSKDQIKRKLLIPGAFTILKLKYEKYDKENLIHLAKFHSLNIPNFLNSEEGKKYKNDNLAIDYYKIILTLLNKPNDPDALYGIGKIYYNQKKFNLASEEFQKIIDMYPDNILGHDGILNTYIEIWKENQDPRYVIAKHRYLQRIGLEKDLPIYTLAKLASFYIEIEPEELRIKYNVDPVNTLNQLNIQSTIENLLDIIFNKKEERDPETILGNQYGEGFYQRGRYLYKKKEYQNAVKQFQNAFYYDSKHFPSLFYLGLHYLYNLKDYEKSKEYFLKSLENYFQFKEYYGIRPEDETLDSFNKGLLYYELASTIFEKYKNQFVPPITSLNEPNEDYQKLLKEINSSEEYNESAIKELKDQKKLLESYFRRGMIEYLNGNFQEALNFWLNIEDTKVLESANYYLAIANAAYYSNQKKQALNFYFQAKNFLEKKTNISNDEKKILYFVYNNIGTTYESILNNEKNKLPRYKLDELQKKSLEYYYKAIEYAIQNKILPNKAKLNIDLFLKREEEELLLEDEILFHL